MYSLATLWHYLPAGIYSVVFTMNSFTLVIVISEGKVAEQVLSGDANANYFSAKLQARSEVNYSLKA